MKTTCPFIIVFQVLKVLLLNIYKIQLPVFLFHIVVYISFLSADIILQLFKTLFCTYLTEKNFHYIFSFFNRFT